MEPVSSFCPRCGAYFPTEVLGELIRTSVRCPECFLALAEVPAMLAPSDREVEYVLEESPVADRAAVTGALSQFAIPYRWAKGIVLVVPADVEGLVDGILEDLESEGGAEADGDGDADGADDVDEAEGGEQAQAAMADPFVACDRLQHAPWDERAAVDLAVATRTIGGCAAPYGIDRQAWRRVQNEASGLMTAVMGDVPGPVVAEMARALREFLREYV